MSAWHLVCIFVIFPLLLGWAIRGVRRSIGSMPHARPNAGPLDRLKEDYVHDRISMLELEDGIMAVLKGGRPSWSAGATNVIGPVYGHAVYGESKIGHPEGGGGYHQILEEEKKCGVCNKWDAKYGSYCAACHDSHFFPARVVVVGSDAEFATAQVHAQPGDVIQFADFYKIQRGARGLPETSEHMRTHGILTSDYHKQMAELEFKQAAVRVMRSTP